jgi:two-component system sensor histidine kinase YesM
MVSRINQMLGENTKLVEEVYAVKFAQKEAQIGALFNQIKPHFIFNTLNMISLLVQNGKEDKAVDHINQLSYIMRNITYWQKEVTFKHELELLKSYLSIQCSRFEERLDYTIDMDSSFESYLVPAFLLQPIIENAVIHGCEVKKSKTTIHITSEMHPDGFIIEVRDNGKGMDEQTLHRLSDKLAQAEQDNIPAVSPAEGFGIGLTNVNRRIKLKFGKAFGLTVDSELNKGTSVRIKLPTSYPERTEPDHV